MSRRPALILGLALLLAGCGGKPDSKSAPSPEASGGSGAPAPAPEVGSSAPAPSPVETETPGHPIAPLIAPRATGSDSTAPRTALAPRVEAAREKRPPFKTIRVFYGTNRAATGSRVPAAYFGTENGPLSFGFCDVSIPHDHQTGELESPRLWKFEFREDPEKHVVLMRVTPAAGPEFITELQRAVWESIEWEQSPDGPAIRGGEAFIFVHGFNNSFEDAARRTAQIASDVKFRGAPILYSWPSQASPTLRGYQDDGEFAGWSQEHFLAFLAGVARESGARKIHVIAHSMGNRLVTETLRRLSWHFSTGELPKFNQVILAAPDVDAEYFKLAIAPRIVQTADRITIYSSSRDIALRASSWANLLGRRRLGEAGEELMTFPEFGNIEMIDASTVDTDLFTLHHSYNADNPTVLGDMAQVLRGLSPQQRGLRSLLGHLAWQIRETGKHLNDAVRSITAEQPSGASRR